MGRVEIFLRKNVLTVAIPYLIWGLVFCNFSFKNLGWLMYGSWKALSETGTVTSLWYLSCLFCARILVQIVVDVMERLVKPEKQMYYLIPAAVFMVIGVLLPDIAIGYPWCLNVAFVAAGCILMGIAIKKGVIVLSVQKGWLLAVLLTVSVAVYALAVSLFGDEFTTMMMCKGNYGKYPLVSLVLAVAGGTAVMLVAMLLKRMGDEWLPNMNYSSLVYLGQHTMGVFLLHKPMLQNVFVPLFESLIPDINILARLLATIVSLLLSLCLCRLIEYYIPELVGIFSKDKIAGEIK